MRLGSAASLPVSTASTGLLCFSVGAGVHRIRSDTEVSMWLLPREHHIQCMTYIYSLAKVRNMHCPMLDPP